MVWGDAQLLEHARSCDVCTAELAQLKKRRDFRDAFPVLSSIADQSKPAPLQTQEDEIRRRATRRHLMLMSASVIAIVGFYLQNRGVSPQAESADGDAINGPAPPRYRISNIDNALFESKVDGTTVTSSMSRGVAAFQVEKLRPGQRFLLTLPDGDLEVRGTQFVVAIDRGKTESVEVNDGAVTLRLAGRAEMNLSAGERWPASRPERPTVSFLRKALPSDAGAVPPQKNTP